MNIGQPIKTWGSEIKGQFAFRRMIPLECLIRDFVFLGR
jgi:hypothetical protein